jgi:putative regulatory protein, FmdB family
MPLYEYKCNKCNNKFETLVLSSDDEINCPDCNSTNLEKLFSTFGVKSEDSFSSSSIPVGSGCGCTPTSCGCKH